MSDIHNRVSPKPSHKLNEYESADLGESKFWRKVKQDPVVPIGMTGFGLIVLGAIIGFNRRDRSKPTSTYWIRTRVYAQGFVVSLLTAAAVYQAVKGRPEPRDIHGHKKVPEGTSPSTNHH
ncbi:unnamed protein product [Adineta steineri]|uniref:HIG1 domain-containing protein n=1 Tax=Adineta steineri TaxID=433720 RepID=A0A814WQH5_9BILA|nr:unnamed protein product [Adineta steineri]CAF0892603.1 unnamed protein product [Adineta steineri]CAF0917591.1 unnamed protein product [Adineta steineri]CAF1006177.1 unnamed protein product [Adineta steineri]CAF1205420.1 unnamed protein product [Adineta steineri]